MYLDANFFIYLHTEESAQGLAARTILSRIVKGELAFTSVLTLDEVMWVFRKLGRRGELAGILEETYATQNLEVLPVSSSIPLAALDLMEKHNLKPRDAFHVAIMKEKGIKTIVSTDADFDKVPSIKRLKF
ncbi:TPA: type II toxin-antitoxin system VapC family toxin [Candidatus Woesearchaeota archaeon]|nr:type II toxin-antitoxin system VapC family toxin [Candidatus Woesearchaeota archaeon]